MSTQQTALVIDDHPLVARGVADFLCSHCAFNHATAVTDVTSLWNSIDAKALPLLIVVDFWLPDHVSLPLLTELKAAYPCIYLLVMSADDNPAIKHKVRDIGVHGFLNKQEDPAVFARAVHAILLGETWFSATTTSASSTYPSNELPITAQELGLTARQGQILSMIISGLPNKRIANALGLSEQTVKEHVSGILERLNAHNRVELITKLRGKRIE